MKATGRAPKSHQPCGFYCSPTALYAIVFKDTYELLTPEKIKEVWPNYGQSGYKPSKKIYESLTKAIAGFAHVPERLKPLLMVQAFEPKVGSSVDGSELMVKQAASRKKREELQEKKNQAFYAAGTSTFQE